MRKAIHRVSIEVYGVKICIESNEKAISEEITTLLGKIFPIKFKIYARQTSDHVISINAGEEGFYEFRKNEDDIFSRKSKAEILEILESKLRLTVAEFAVSKVFLHAGVVAWNGKAVVLPASSMQGKTTLVAELVKKGALYYSDEYAVIDRDGFVHPFPKMLSLRRNDGSFVQEDHSVESLGGRAGTRPIPVGIILLTEFKSNLKMGKWKPKRLSIGEGILETINHNISIRNNPAFALKVLKKAAGNAIFLKSKRGEATGFADLLINFIGTSVNQNAS